ncbi:FtsX-like permease family protein [Streptomyces sp. NPDC051041]|uniref:FtsX-like permease family protein n=1 Tax=Streptomyces sp. NPDC051041 TaxID=3365640 RepID=UPI0037AF7B66
MFGLALRTLRFRKGGFLASFVALFFGAAIVAACGGLMETGIRANASPQRFAAAPVVVTGDQVFDEVLPERARIPGSLVDRIAALPGVERALPDVSFAATALDGDRTASGGGKLTGHGWSSARISGAPLVAGAAPRRAGEAALDARLAGRLGLKAGDDLRLVVAGGTASVRVSGVVRSTAGTATAVYFTDAEAARLLGARGQVDAVAVFPEPGVGAGALRERVAPVLKDTGARAVTGDERGTAEFPQALEGATRLISMSAVFGGIAVMVVVFVVGSTLAVLVQQRMREMALLRAVGSLPGQIRRMVAGETLVVGVLATALALAPGRTAGRLMLEQIADGGVVAPQVAYRAGWIPLVAAAGAALAAALAAAFIASRRAALVRPAAALAEAGLQQRWLSAPRLVCALLCFAGGTALAVVTATVMPASVASSTAGPSAMLWASGIALVCPGLTRVLAAALRPPLRLFSGLAGRLAADNVRARRIRTADAVTPVMLATGLATALVYLQTSQHEAAPDAASAFDGAQAVIGSSTGGLSPELLDEVAALPGVSGVSAYVPDGAFVVAPAGAGAAGGRDAVTRPDGDPDSTELPVRGVSPQGIGSALHVTAAQGSFAELRGDTIALPASLTDEAGRGVGDSVVAVLGDGVRVTVKVVASHEPAGGAGTAFLPADLMLEHSTSGPAPQLLVFAGQGVSGERLQESLRTLRDTRPGLLVSGPAEAEVAAEDASTGAWINYMLAATIIGYAVISLVNTLVVAASERRGEFALQRLVGATRGQVMRMMTVEALLVAVMGTVLGSAVAAATLVPFALALAGSWLPGGPVWIYLSIVGFVGALTVAATLLPVRFALRSGPAGAPAAP